MNEAPRPSSSAPDAATPSAGAVSAPKRRVHEVSWWRYLLLLPLSWLARVWTATLRFEISEEERACISNQTEPMIISTWHNRLFIAGEVQRRYRRGVRLVSLISASRDGAWLAAYFKLMGFEAVRGSSSWRGMQALRELLSARQSGADLGITPDGPRGPCYEMKPGMLLLARHAHCPLLIYSARFDSAWRLRSWDGFYLPKPFSVVKMRARLLPGYASLGAADDEAAARELRRQMMELTTDG